MLWLEHPLSFFIKNASERASESLVSLSLSHFALSPPLFLWRYNNALHVLLNVRNLRQQIVHGLFQLLSRFLEQNVSVHEPGGVSQTDQLHDFRQQRDGVDCSDDGGGQPQRDRRTGDVRDHLAFVFGVVPLFRDSFHEFFRVKLLRAND